ncbi:triacylglycerol lipase 1 [Actinidia eriantha]|uniref:triacylglycerol lipase 1 n=1 Tax=Actinidia eriantha TaxID=165200 RepID=UPI002587856D|nr:triacylglycerol lipase 1 [Actinidia eriantha]
MERLVGVAAVAAVAFFLTLSSSATESDNNFTGDSNIRRRPPVKGLCADVIERYNHPCSEHKVQTKDGYVLGLHRVSSRSGILRKKNGPPVLLLHGLFMAGDAWFLDSMDQSLGYILADHGFDVWAGSVRGTFWSHGHTCLSEKDKDFWNWSWEELALYDLTAMLHYVHVVSHSKVFVVGHSQGTIMSLAAFTEPDIVKMVQGAALLCPITYLEHVSAPLVLRLVSMHLDQLVLALGIHQLNFRSDIGVQLLDSICDGHVDCNDLLASITGTNCCMNISRVDFYLEYEPHPSSSKNLNHLFQMIRKGTFAKYDYGKWKNLKRYGTFEPPKFDLSRIPKSLPLWMGYGGNDALADPIDFQHTLEELKSKPELLFLENYGHVDFLSSVTANRDVYDSMIRFFRSSGRKSSS